jgi:uncharacterized membrane protein YdcZ (DUF606 family)
MTAMSDGIRPGGTGERQRRFRRFRPGRSRFAVHLPFALVIGVVAVGFVRIAMYHWREGAGLVAVAMLLAAVFRALLSDERAGLLVIRSRGVDVFCYAGLGILLAAVALTISRSPYG